MKAMEGSSIQEARQAKAVLRTDPRLPLNTSIGIGKAGSGYFVKVNLVTPMSVDLPCKINGVSIVYEVTSEPRAGGPGAW